MICDKVRSLVYSDLREAKPVFARNTIVLGQVEGCKLLLTFYPFVIDSYDDRFLEFHYKLFSSDIYCSGAYNIILYFTVYNITRLSMYM